MNCARWRRTGGAWPRIGGSRARRHPRGNAHPLAPIGPRGARRNAGGVDRDARFARGSMAHYSVSSTASLPKMNMPLRPRQPQLSGWWVMAVPLDARTCQGPKLSCSIVSWNLDNWLSWSVRARELQPHRRYRINDMTSQFRHMRLYVS